MTRRPECLSPGELVDAADGVLTTERAAHLASCERCRHEVSVIAETMAEIGAVDVPEPPPFVWAALNRRIAAAIDGDRGAAWGWLRWDTLVPLAGLAALLVALGSAISPPPAPAGRRTAAPHLAADAEPQPQPEPIAADPSAADAALDLVADLAGSLPDAGADTLGLAPLPDLADIAAMALSADEQRALEALLRDAVDRPAS